MTIRTITLITAIIVATASQAGILGTSGEAFVVKAAFTDVREGKHESDCNIWVMEENTGVKLGTGLSVDIAAPGSFYKTSDLPKSMPTIAKGTVVDSYLLYTDRTDRHLWTNHEGSVTFTGKVLGIIVKSKTLDNTDAVLGKSSTLYPYHLGDRGLELTPGKIEGVTWNGNTVNFSACTISAVDQVRVVTEAVPEPASLLALAFGIGGAFVRRMKKRI